MMRLYGVSQPTVSPIVAAHPANRAQRVEPLQVPDGSDPQAPLVETYIPAR
jgi:hypothetical protein